MARAIYVRMSAADMANHAHNTSMADYHHSASRSENFHSAATMHKQLEEHHLRTSVRIVRSKKKAGSVEVHKNPVTARIKQRRVDRAN